MKTAIALPDALFEDAERLARRMGKTRSELYRTALADYIARHAPDEVTEAMNAVCDQIEEQDSFVAEASRRALERSEW